MLDIVTKYGVDPSELMTEQGLAKLTAIFESEVGSLSEQVVSTQDREKEIRSAILADSDLESEVTEAFKSVRSAVSDILDTNEQSAALLFVLLQDLKSDTGNYRDYVVSTMAKGERKAPTNDAEIEEAKANLAELRDAITSVWTLLGKPSIVQELDEETEEVTVLFSTKTGKNGDVSPHLPRIPSVTRSGNVGRGAKIRQMQFKVNGENVPEGYLFRDVVYHLINDMAEGITFQTSEIVEMVRDQGYEFASKGEENAWTIEVGNVELTGWLPVDSGEEEE